MLLCLIASAAGPRPLVRTVFAALLAAFALAAAPEPAQADRRNEHLTDQDRADLDRVSKYLNGIRTMQGRFAQTAQDGGVATGRFWMRKPGRLKFEYDPPAPIELVADGTNVAVIDKELETTNTYPLSGTPLKLILAKRVDLAKEADIVQVLRRDGQIIVTAREDEGVASGEITLFFDAETLDLRQWVILDAQGTRVAVALLDVEEGIKLPRSMFRIEEDSGWGD